LPTRMRTYHGKSSLVTSTRASLVVCGRADILPVPFCARRELAGALQLRCLADGWRKSQRRVITDAAGNLDGTTEFGGAKNKGTVFKLSPSGQLKVLYSFAGSKDGAEPFAGLIFDARGKLYGTAAGG
jgi:uncharacterized repeat protein (TIGR03803 family)